MASSGFLSWFGRLFGGSSAAGDAPDPGARLSYSNDGRSGRVRYQSAAADFTMYFEFGGGDCIAVVELPRPREWQRQTGLPLAQRDDVIQWIGRQVVRDQTRDGSGRFEIDGNWLNLYGA